MRKTQSIESRSVYLVPKLLEMEITSRTVLCLSEGWDSGYTIDLDE